jgi:DNA gyrase inhibitor GyrI
MNGVPHNAKVPLLGFAGTAEEAQKAASEVFDIWLERSGLVIDPAVSRTFLEVSDSRQTT